MAQFFIIHPDNPQLRLLNQAAAILRRGGLIALPTESGYVLAAHLDDKIAVERIRRLRGIDDKHYLTLLCRDLSELSAFAKVDNQQFRLLKTATPGPFVLILKATSEVPKRLFHPTRKTIGLRISGHTICQTLLAVLGQPLLTSTLQLANMDTALNDAEEIRRYLEHDLDLIIDGGPCPCWPTTVIDLSGEAPEVLRLGQGDPARLGL